MTNNFDSEMIVNFLKKVKPFNVLDQRVLEQLSKKIIIKTYPAQTYIVRQGFPSQRRLFIVVNGEAEVIVTADKQQSVIDYRKPYDFFGETALLMDREYSGSVRTLEKLTCCIILREDIEELIFNYPAFAGFFSKLLTERIRSLYDEIIKEQYYEAYSKVESPLFRKRVSEIMSSPIITCKPDDHIISASKIMAINNVSALVVVDDNNIPQGFLTEKNIVKYLIAGQIAAVENCTVEMVMNRNLICIAPDELFYNAMLAMIKNKTKHLAVVDKGKLIGIVTVMDLIKTRSTGTLLLTHDIESQYNFSSLAHVSDEIDNILNALIAEKASIPEIFEIMSELHDRLASQVINICEREMELEGWGKPPVKYCWLHMGSAGRKEQTLRTDQDNAIIYSDPDEHNKDFVAAYFEQLARKIVDGLSTCGFEKCKGGVMASNPAWRRSLSEWAATVRSWIGSVDPKDTRFLTIFLDYRPIYGDSSLAQKLRTIIFEQFREAVRASHMMANEDFQYKVPVGLFGGFITEKSGPHKGEINLKNAACIHIVNCTRIFAVKSEISETSTFERLQALVKAGVITKDDGEFIQASYETLMMFRIRENVKKVKQGKQPDNYINPQDLSKREVKLLKEAFTVISRLQKLTHKEFNVFWLAQLG